MTFHSSTLPRTLTLVLGGARSGKSSYAQRQVERRGNGQELLYVATAEAQDGEMLSRIQRHRSERSEIWRTLEEPLDLASALPPVAPVAGIVLIDCITLLVSNLLIKLEAELPVEEIEKQILAEIEKILAVYRSGTASWWLVSNEVGLGIVPAYPLGRSYRDALGRVNARLAAEADQVIFMVAGLPLAVKGVLPA